MKERIDILLVKNGFFENVDKAKRAVMAGIVVVNDKRAEKAGEMYKSDAEIRIKGEKIPYVSRGGLKLEKAIKEFRIEMKGKMVIDVGASTGGFSDCALKHGAAFVYAVDVGTNQLDWVLRNNENVKSIENTHIKDLTEEDIDNRKADYIVIDVSFISLCSVIPAVKKHLKSDGKIVALIKPQFEAKKDKIEKGGIVKNFEEHKRILEKVLEKSEEYGIYMEAVSVSPITGTYGNIEYLGLFSMNNENKNNEIDSALEKAKKLNEGST